MKKIITLLLAFVLSMSIVTAYQLETVALDSNSLEPIMNAQITIDGIIKNANPQDDGFAIFNVPADSVLVAEHKATGYTTEIEEYFFDSKLSTCNTNQNTCDLTTNINDNIIFNTHCELDKEYNDWNCKVSNSGKESQFFYELDNTIIAYQVLDIATTNNEQPNVDPTKYTLETVALDSQNQEPIMNAQITVDGVIKNANPQEDGFVTFAALKDSVLVAEHKATGYTTEIEEYFFDSKLSTCNTNQNTCDLTTNINDNLIFSTHCELDKEYNDWNCKVSNSGKESQFFYELDNTIITYQVLDRNSQNTNELPIADFNVDSPTKVTNIQFNAATSSDDKGIIEYLWDFGDGNIQTTTSAIITHTYSNYGTYTVGLVVRDNENELSTVKTKTLQIITNQNPIINSLDHNPIYVNQETQLTLDFTDDDDEHTIYWLVDDEAIQGENLNQITHTFTTIGTHMIKVSIHDPYYGNSNKDFTVEVTEIPTIDLSLTGPSEVTITNQFQEITLDASQSTGPIVKYDLLINGAKYTEGTGMPTSLQYVITGSTIPGDKIFTLNAYDQFNNKYTTQHTLIVHPQAIPLNAVITGPNEITKTDDNQIITLDASQSTGPIVKYDLLINDIVVQHEETSPTNIIISITSLNEGINTIKLKIYDSNDNINEISHQINVIIPEITNEAPTIEQIPDVNLDYNQDWSYQINYNNDDSNIFSILQGPTDMTISETGLIHWVATTSGVQTITIRLMDGNGQYADSTFTLTVSQEIIICSTKTDTLQLNEGWNLFSFDVTPTSNLITSILNPIEGKYSLVKGFDQGGKVYDPSLPQFSDLTELDAIHGYWIKMNEASTLTITGTELCGTQTIPLKEGWNLISYLDNSPKTVASALSSINGKYTIVKGFDNGALVYDPNLPQFSDLTEMNPNFGYWVKVTEDTNLIYTGD